jgi:nucleotide-binding universal stress UspA family protein
MAATHDRHVLAGYDGSPDAAGAIELGARLLPGCSAQIVHLWAPPFSGAELRARVLQRAATVHEMMEMLESEAQAQADRVAAEGVTLAQAAGWDAEPYPKRAYGAEGLELAALAEELAPAALVVGSRGLTGVRAMLGSVSDEAVHASPVPVLVVPRAILSPERESTASGPIIVGNDGSEGAARAAESARELFEGREIVVARVAFEEEGDLPEGAVTVPPVGVTRSGRAVADALVREARAVGAGAIVVGSRGRSAVGEMLLGSVAMATLHHTDRPVMVVPSRQAPAGG